MIRLTAIGRLFRQKVKSGAGEQLRRLASFALGRASIFPEELQLTDAGVVVRRQTQVEELA